MADTVDCTRYTDSCSISEGDSQIAATDLDGHEHLSDAAARLAKLDAQAARIQLSLVKMCVYVTVGVGEVRQRAIDACIAARLMDSPIESVMAEVERVVTKVMNDARSSVQDAGCRRPE